MASTRQIFVLSGPIASGKSALAENLRKQFVKVFCFRTSDLIGDLREGVTRDRGAMQQAGEALDKETSGRWVGKALARRADDLPDGYIFVVDAVRIAQQVEGIREAFGPRVVHVHLTASLRELGRRYKRRRKKYCEFATYADARIDPTECQIKSLEAIADVVVNTDQCSEQDVLVRTAAALRLFPASLPTIVDVIVGGQYGSEGKGNIVSYLAAEYDILMRVGGPNAGHKVYEEPEPYTFHQLPSGTRHSSADLVIGPGAVIRLETLLKEINECEVSHKRLSIDPSAMIIEQEDVDFERRGLKDKIGSTAQGVGAAGARRILRGAQVDGFPPVRLVRDVEKLRAYMRPAVEILEQAYALGKRILLEGTQGTSLSLYHGSYPHVTSRDTTAAGCLAEAGLPPGVARRVAGRGPPGGAGLQNLSDTRGQHGTWQLWADVKGNYLEEDIIAVRDSH